MTFLEGDQLDSCDLLEQENSLLRDVNEVSATRSGRYIAVTSGFKAKRYILRHPGLHQPRPPGVSGERTPRRLTAQCTYASGNTVRAMQHGATVVATCHGCAGLVLVT